MPVQIGVEQRWMVVERGEKLHRKKREKDDVIDTEGWRNVIYDPNSFSGSVTLAQITDIGPAYFDTMEVEISDRSVYEKYKLGAIIRNLQNFEEQPS